MTQSMTQTRFWRGTKPSKLLKGMVGLCGLEPQTSCVSSRRSNQTELQTQVAQDLPGGRRTLTHTFRFDQFLNRTVGFPTFDLAFPWPSFGHRQIILLIIKLPWTSAPSREALASCVLRQTPRQVGGTTDIVLPATEAL